VLPGVVAGDPVEAPPPGVPDAPPPGVGLAGELVPGGADGLADGFLLARGLDTAGVAGAVGPAAPPTGPDVLAAPDAFCDGIRLRPGAPVVEDPAGSWFAAGVPLNAPETRSATRPALARTAAPAASAPARRRGVA
jgi:hypothetical protein